MFKRVVIGLLAMTAVGILTVTADAWITSSGWGAKGVRCIATANHFSGTETKGGAAGATCEPTNVTAAIIWCTNNPNSGFNQGAAARTIVYDYSFTFPQRFQGATGTNCEPGGNCAFNIVMYATAVGFPSSLCVNETGGGFTWYIVDVVPLSFIGFLRQVKCYDARGKLVTCDSDSDGYIDPAVTTSITDSETAHCTLPNPETLQFGEERLYDCIVS